MAKTKKRAPTKRYKGFLAKPRKLTRAEAKRDAGLPTSPEEKLAAEHDTYGHWGLIYEELCAEYGLDPDATPASMKFLWIRMAKRHVPAARDLALPGKTGRPRRWDTAGSGLTNIIDRILGHLTGDERTEASLKIARFLLGAEDAASRVPSSVIRAEAEKIREASRQRLRTPRTRPKK